MDDPLHSLFALQGAAVYELGNSLHLPALAFRFVGGFYHFIFQRGIIQARGIKPL